MGSVKKTAPSTSTVIGPVQLSCDDGVFPTVANVVGLLTFAYAIAAGLLVYYRSFRNVSRNVKTILANNRSSHFGALALPSDFWSSEKIRSTIEGNQLLGIQREASLAACDNISGLGEHARQFLKGYGRSVGFRDWLRFMSSQQDVAEKTVSVSRALETLKAIDIRFVMSSLNALSIGP